MRGEEEGRGGGIAGGGRGGERRRGNSLRVDEKAGGEKRVKRTREPLHSLPVAPLQGNGKCSCWMCWRSAEGWGTEEGGRGRGGSDLFRGGE